MEMKRGFTLIEIIVCISLIAIIGTTSFFGIRLVSKNITIEKLEQIKDKILLATEIYIETNKETYNKLYNEKNGVLIPLNVLVNEGLLDITGTKIDDEELKNNYVISMLTNDPPTGGCKNIKTVTSWNESSNEPLFICVDENGKSNLAIIDPTKYGNLNTVKTEPYYFKGSAPNNFAKFGTHNLRILSVDTDDSITVTNPLAFDYNGITFKTIFNENMVFSFSNYHQKNSTQLNKKCSSNKFRDSGLYYYGYGHELDYRNYYNVTECSINYGTNEKYNSVYGYGYGYSIGIDNTWVNQSTSYLHLKNCIKITSGTGSPDNPYILEDKGC